MSKLFEFHLPDIGEGVAEGEIVDWKVQAGDEVAEDQVLLEVMTDKATVEISSPVKGRIEAILVGAGEVAPVGAVLVTIAPAAGAHVPTSSGHGDGHAKPAAAPKKEATPSAAPAKGAQAMPPESAKGQRSTKASELPDTPQPPEEGEDAEAQTAQPPRPAAKPQPAKQAPPKQAAKPAPAAAKAPAAEKPAGRRALAAPYTRRLAREAGIDIDTVEGTGEAGRVTEEDVRRHVEAASRPAETQAPEADEAAAAEPARRAPAHAAAAPGDRETRVPIRGLRKRISERMHQSKTTAAHFTYVDECDVTNLVRLRGEMKERAAKRGVKLTYMPFICKALVSAFHEFPSLNGTTDDEAQEFAIKHYFNFGVAVDTDAGLIVPVVKDVDKRSLLDLAQEIERVANDAREGKSKLEDLKDGTFTITNAGNIGGLFATPIINYPEAAILGVHAIKKTPRVVEDKIEIRDVMYLSISIDHRMNDGAVGARFMNHVIGLLQDPAALILEM